MNIGLIDRRRERTHEVKRSERRKTKQDREKRLLIIKAKLFPNYFTPVD